MTEPITVVGIGADGWDGLSAIAQALVEQADVVFGSTRQLATVRTDNGVTWPSPLLPQLRSMIEAYDGRRVCVLASGDPMFFGIGVTLVREFGVHRLHVLPAPSSVSLACARLGWALHDTPTVSLVDSPVHSLLTELAHGRRLLVLSRGSSTPGEVVGLLTHNGYGGSGVTLLEQLGGPREHVRRTTASGWHETDVDPLNIVALECILDSDAPRSTRIPGLADGSFVGDGQFTKQEVRALTISALAPAPGELLWDVGGGSGTIAIEWMRTERTCRATTFELSVARRAQIAENAKRLGVPGIQILGGAPDEFSSAPAPDAIFVGGGVTQHGLVDSCWNALSSRGRIVANSVTAESDSMLLDAASRYGGALRRFQIYRGEGLGSFTAWRPHLPVTQWIAVKE